MGTGHHHFFTDQAVSSWPSVLLEHNTGQVNERVGCQQLFIRGRRREMMSGSGAESVTKLHDQKIDNWIVDCISKKVTEIGR